LALTAAHSPEGLLFTGEGDSRFQFLIAKSL
jgi:hypothetical protein